MRFLVIGELNPDLIPLGYRGFPALGREVLVEDLSLTLGSASAIRAAGLARLGNPVRFAAACGAPSTRAMGGTGSQATAGEAGKLFQSQETK
jgi:sugar/nucleoside kinase (ribokinase family)